MEDTLETVLAKKYKTIIYRNIGATCAGDFYDLHVLYRRHKEDIRMNVLKIAVLHTATKHGALDELTEWEEIFEDMKTEKFYIDCGRIIFTMSATQVI